jgi:hypothetical protein
VIPYYFAPGISGYKGRPPVAMRILSAVMYYLEPSCDVSYSLLGEMNLASLLKYYIF